MSRYPTKPERIRTLAAHIAGYHSPRLEFVAILCATVLIGFLSTRFMLSAGIHSMAIRYPASTLVAYIAFLLFSGMWVRAYSKPGVLPTQLPSTLPPPAPMQSPITVSPASDTLNALDLLDISEGGCLGLIGLFLTGLLFLAAASIVSEAPSFLSELLLETSILGTLYPKLRGLPRAGWLSALYGRTWLPVTILAIFMFILGRALHSLAPEAHSIGGVPRFLGNP